MFSFYGAKRRLAPFYPQPSFDRIIEPFCGSAAYSLYGDNWQKDVNLYDIDERIVTVWNYLISASYQDIISLPMFGAGTNIDSFQSLSQPEKWFLGYMISAATRNPKKTATVKTNWNDRSRQRIAESIYKVKHWKAERLDFRKIPNKQGTWFVDPPYELEGKWYDHRLKSTDFIELKACVESWNGEVIVCESVEAKWLDFCPLVTAKGQSNNHKTEGIYYKRNDHESKVVEDRSGREDSEGGINPNSTHEVISSIPADGRTLS